MAGTAEVRTIPERARYRGRLVVVLAYEGDGRFLVEDGSGTTTIHRDHLDFLRPVVKAGAAVDEVLEVLLPVSFSGRDERGIIRTGEVEGSVVEFVETRFEAGWRALTVVRDGLLVGGIRLNSVTKMRERFGVRS